MTETFCGLPKRIAAVGVAAGACVAGAWLLSPIGLCIGVLMAVIFAGTLRGLTPRERRWVAGLLGAALALRLLALLAFAMSVDYSRDQFPILIGDERYSKNVALWLHNIYFGIPISPSNFGNAFAWRHSSEGLFYALAYAQILLGPAPYAGHFLNIACFFGGTLLLYRIVRASYGPIPALGSLAVVLFLPTLFVWSISALKEPPHVLMLSVIIVASLAIVRGTTWPRRVAALGLTLASIVAVDTLRLGTLPVGIATVCGAYAATVVTTKRWSLLLVIALSVGVLIAVGQSSGAQARGLSLVQLAAERHLGHVRVPGYSYKLLDQRFYERSASVTTMTMSEGARFVVRAAVSFVVVPAPGQATSRSALAYLPQQVVWYVLFLLAVVGCMAGFRKDALLTFLLLATTLFYGAGVALTGGNIGTTVRHRDLVVPIAAWFSGLGATSILTWMAVRGGKKRVDNSARLETLPGAAGL